MNFAGSRRKRANAVELNVPDYVDPRQTGRGRPTKGGQAVRAHRYYAKNHLLVLQKRRLKRYTTKVKKLLQENEFNSATILKLLEDYLKSTRKQNLKSMDENELLVFLDLTRDDRYLGFLNDEGEKLIQGLYAGQLETYPSPDRLEVIAKELENKHSTVVFRVSTLLSAYLLMHYLEELDYDAEDDESPPEQKYMKRCEKIYLTTYTHLQPPSDDNGSAPPTQQIITEHYEEAQSTQESSTVEKVTEDNEEEYVNNDDEENQQPVTEEEEEEQASKKRRFSINSFLSRIKEN